MFMRVFICCEYYSKSYRRIYFNISCLKFKAIKETLIFFCNFWRVYYEKLPLKREVHIPLA